MVNFNQKYNYNLWGDYYVYWVEKSEKFDKELPKNINLFLKC